MIRRLRRRHRLAWTVLFPILAILLTCAWLARPEPPLAEALPEGAAGAVPAGEMDAPQDGTSPPGKPPANER